MLYFIIKLHFYETGAGSYFFFSIVYICLSYLAIESRYPWSQQTAPHHIVLVYDKDLDKRSGYITLYNFTKM